MISRGLTSLPWGWASDKYGRRPVLLIGCFSMFVFQLWFGFSRTFSSAICARAALGAFFNGLVGTAKTVAGEVTQGHGAEAASRSMGYVSAGVLLGMIVGPSMGGWLSDPPSQRSNSTSLLAEYPYALPNVVGSAFALLSGTVIYFLLPETKRNEYSHVELTAIDNDNDAENDGNVPTASVPPKSRVISSLVLQSCTVYAVHSFCAIWLNEIFPLWCIASVDSGGLGLDLDEVGSILSASGIAVLVYQVFLFSWISSLLSRTRLMSICMIIQCFTTLTLSNIKLADGTSTCSESVCIYLVGVVYVAHQICTLSAFTTVFILINNSSAACNRGTVQGVAMTVASVTKALGPIVGSSLLAWSLTSGRIMNPIILGHRFSFTLVALLWLCSGVVQFARLDTRLNSPLEDG